MDTVSRTEKSGLNAPSPSFTSTASSEDRAETTGGGCGGNCKCSGRGNKAPLAEFYVSAVKCGNCGILMEVANKNYLVFEGAVTDGSGQTVVKPGVVCLRCTSTMFSKPSPITR